MTFRNLSLCFAFSLLGCSSSGASPGPGDAANDTSPGSIDAQSDAPAEAAPDAPSDAAPDVATQSCSCKDCVCGYTQSASCTQTFASTDCLQGGCCVLAPDAGPPYYDDAGSCPGTCASPDDIGCNSWFRSNVCAGGDLCCVLKVDAGHQEDAGAAD